MGITFIKNNAMDLKQLKIAVLGVGNLGTALVHGMLESGVKPENIFATRRDLSKLDSLRLLGINIGSDNKEAILGVDCIILAVKPFNYDIVLNEIADVADGTKQVLISVITGVTMESISSRLPSGMPVLRAMPNTAADVKESVTCICQNGAKPEQIEMATSIFNALGSTQIIKEELMNSATVLGACGIAYVMRFIRAMVQGGIEIGFDAETASAIVQQTVKGAASLLLERKSHPESEIDKVTTPKGCTIAGLNEMEHNGFSSALIKGLKASMNQIENP